MSEERCPHNIKGRLEAALMFLNMQGPSGLSEVRDATDMTKGESEYTIRKSGQFVRVGPNDCLWAATRTSSLWNADAERECGHGPWCGSDGLEPATQPAPAEREVGK